METIALLAGIYGLWCVLVWIGTRKHKETDIIIKEKD